MNKLLTNFMANSIDLNQFIEGLLKGQLCSEETIHQILESSNDEDHSAIAYLILYYIYKFPFKLNNPFISFLDSIEYETSNDFSKELKVHYLKENIMIFQIDHLFFIINNQEEQANVLLPSNLQNDYQFCVNCNHDLYFKEQLILEPYEFYIISDAK